MLKKWTLKLLEQDKEKEPFGSILATEGLSPFYVVEQTFLSLFSGSLKRHRKRFVGRNVFPESNTPAQHWINSL